MEEIEMNIQDFIKTGDTEYQINVFLGTVKGRHRMPVNQFFFQEDIKDFSAQSIQHQTTKFWTEFINEFQKQMPEELKGFSADELYQFRIHLYVTGLTIATTSIIKMCIENEIRLTLYHYDPTTQSYQKQIML